MRNEFTTLKNYQDSYPKLLDIYLKINEDNDENSFVESEINFFQEYIKPVINNEKTELELKFGEGGDVTNSLKKQYISSYIKIIDFLDNKKKSLKTKPQIDMDNLYYINEYLQSCNTHSIFDLFDKRDANGAKNINYLGDFFNNWAESSNNRVLNIDTLSEEQKNIFIGYNNVMCSIGNNTMRLYKSVCDYNNTNEGATINAINHNKNRILSELNSLNFYANMIKTKFDFEEEVFAKKLHNHCHTRFEDLVYNLKLLTIDIYNSPLQEDFKRAYSTLNDAYNFEEIKLFREIRKKKSTTETETKNPFPNIFMGDDERAFNVFDDFSKEVTDYFLDYSFIFQKMKSDSENLIKNRLRHKEFMDWLFQNEYISDKVYSEFKDKESFSKKTERGMRVTRYYKIKEKHFPIDSD